MGKFIEVRTAGKANTKILLNTDHIISVTYESFNGTTKVLVQGMMFELDEKYEDIRQMITPN